jgi:hypothetical protein
MNWPDRSPHPDAATLQQFAVGRLRGEAMRRIERHVRDCEVCVETALAAPDDRLVGLLRRAAPRAGVGPRAPNRPVSASGSASSGPGRSPHRT